MNKQLPLILIAAASVAIGLAISVWMAGQNNPPGGGSAPELGGDFTLTSDQGPLGLSDFRGKVVALYFGYTHCPDVCITSLTAIARAMDELEDAEQAQIQPLFITVDPERDDATRVAAYARHFHPRGVGLTGTSEQIAQVARQYLAIYAKVPMEDSAMGYAMDHSSIIYLVGKDGKLLTLVHHGETTEGTAQYLREALAGRGTLPTAG